MQTNLFPHSKTARLLPILGVLLTHAVTAAEPQLNQRPNFLFIYTDDQRWDAMSVVQKEQGDKARFPWFQTPNMDRLAAQGVRFRNAFVTSSLCSPSRACFLTGQYNHLNGIVNNRTPFPLDSVTYASLLKEAGYMTGYIGKWHMGEQQKERPGFIFSASYVGQGTYTDAKFLVNGQLSDVKGYVDDVSTDFALDFLKTNKEKPFVLAVGFKSPHVNFEPAPRNKTLYTGESVKAAANAQPLPPYPVKRALLKVKLDAPKLLDYFRCIAGVDQNLGRILDTLDELGLSKNTIVIYTTDNGFFMGEHGLSDKRAAYEDCLRVPFLVKVPGATGNKTVDDIILNVDLAPTLLDYAGVSIPKQMQGRSIRPLLEGKTVADWRKSFFYEYFYEKRFETPTIIALRGPNGKLVQYPGHEEWNELFDLVNDPLETKNLFLNPEYKAKRAKLEEDLSSARKEVGYIVPAAADPEPAILGGESNSDK